MTLEETMAWLGKQLTHQRSAASPDGKSVQHRGTKLVKAKECALVYWSTIETHGSDPVSPGYDSRELWTLDLSGLNPVMIIAGASGRVSFEAAASSKEAIRTTDFRKEKLFSHSVKRWGYFSVGEKVSTEEVAAGLSHAVKLCRQHKQ